MCCVLSDGACRFSRASFRSRRQRSSSVRLDQRESIYFQQQLATGDAVVCCRCLRRVRQFLRNVQDTPANISGTNPDSSNCPDQNSEPQQYRKSGSAQRSSKGAGNSSKRGSGDQMSGSSGDSGDQPSGDPNSGNSGFQKTAVVAAAAVIGGAATIAAAPLVVAAAGFGSVGIGAGTLAASMMSSAWTTGIGVGVVSTLQSIGAAGLGMTGAATLGAAGGAVGAGVGKLINKVKDGKPNDTANNAGSGGAWKMENKENGSNNREADHDRIKKKDDKKRSDI